MDPSQNKNVQETHDPALSEPGFRAFGRIIAKAMLVVVRDLLGGVVVIMVISVVSPDEVTFLVSESTLRYWTKEDVLESVNSSQEENIDVVQS